MSSRYEVDDEIGGGATGVVFRGRQLRPERPVAFKTLRSEYARDESARQRFLDVEAEVMARLNHPNIVRIYDVVDDIVFKGRDQSSPAIVMELLEGETLADRLKRGPVLAEEATQIADELLQALEHAHRKEVVHRDVKPDNIFLVSDGVTRRVVVTDFGIAKVLSGVALTRTGTQMGAATYMAPEQIEGEPVDARSDLYSAGVVLYQMLAGKPPFDAENGPAVMYAHLEKPPPPLPSSVPANLREAVMRALQKKPEARFASAHEFLLAVRNQVAPPPPPPKWIKVLAIGAMVVGIGALVWNQSQPKTVRATRFEPVAFKIVSRPSSRLPKGKIEVVKSGVAGSLRISEDIVTRWGQSQTIEVGRKQDSAPVDEIRLVGNWWEKTVSREVDIPFRERKVVVTDGRRGVIQKGRVGRRRITEVLTHEGLHVRHKPLPDVVLVAPVDKLTAVPPRRTGGKDGGRQTGNGRRGNGGRTSSGGRVKNAAPPVVIHEPKAQIATEEPRAQHG